MAYTSLTVEMAVPKLITTLQRNREKHLKAYEKAKIGYYKLLEEELVTKLAVLQGERITPSRKKWARLSGIANQKPTNYLAYYDQAIEMLEATLAQTIELDASQFQQYVKDEWNWKADFTTSNVAYAAAAR